MFVVFIVFSKKFHNAAFWGERKRRGGRRLDFNIWFLISVSEIDSLSPGFGLIFLYAASLLTENVLFSEIYEVLSSFLCPFNEIYSCSSYIVQFVVDSIITLDMYDSKDREYKIKYCYHFSEVHMYYGLILCKW